VPALFFVSTGRTGTTLLAEVFAASGARSMHEPAPRWLRLVANAHAAGAVSTTRATTIVRGQRSAAVSASAIPYVEANSLIGGLVRPLLDAFPDSIVVQVVRDPRTYVRSALDWGQYRFAGRALNLVPYRRLAAPHFRPRSIRARLDWALRDQFERLCWTWTAQNLAMRSQGEGHDRFRTIRFEELVDRTLGPTILAGLHASIGLPDPAAGALVAEVERPRNQSGRRSGGGHAKHGGGDRVVEARLDRLIEVCGSEAANYGYDLARRAAGAEARRYGAPRARGVATC